MDVEKPGDLAHCRRLAMLGSLIDRIDHKEMRAVDGFSQPALDLPAEIAPSETSGDLEHGALNGAYSVSPLHDRRPA